MGTTTPLPSCDVRRISECVKAIRSELDWSPSETNTMSLPPAVICSPGGASSPSAQDLWATGYQLYQSSHTLFLVRQRTTPIESFLQCTGSSVSGSTDTGYLIDAAQVEAFLRRQEVARRRYEWDDYPEPLWDPLKSEVQLLVREYFEQADADTD